MIVNYILLIYKQYYYKLYIVILLYLFIIIILYNMKLIMIIIINTFYTEIMIEKHFIFVLNSNLTTYNMSASRIKNINMYGVLCNTTIM